MKNIEFTTICLIVVLTIILSLLVIAHIFYWYKGGYPVEIDIAVMTTCLTEIVLLCKLVIDKRKYKKDENDNKNVQ